MLNQVLYILHELCSIAIMLQAVCVINRMGKRILWPTTLLWIGLGVGAFSNALVPPSEPLLGHMLLLISTTAFVVHPGFLFVVDLITWRRPEASPNKHFHLPW